MSRRILVCDDERVLRVLVRATLAERYEVVEAEDGDQALELALELRPGLIVLDMMMPGRSGLDVLRSLRADPRCASTPVIMLTARTQASDREAASQAGVDHFLAKPFSPAALLGLVQELL